MLFNLVMQKKTQPCRRKVISSGGSVVQRFILHIHTVRVATSCGSRSRGKKQR